MSKIDTYTELAEHLTGSDGWLDYVPENGAFQEILKEIFNEQEARALLHVPLTTVPLKLVPLTEIASRGKFRGEELEKILDDIAARGYLFSGMTKMGEKGYAHLRWGYGFSQIFYWRGDKSDRVKRLAELEKDRELVKSMRTIAAPGEDAMKAWRYIPVTASFEPQWQSVFPTETIEKVVGNAEKFALAHCPCRIKYELYNGENCGHSTEVCLKLDELAEHLINTGHAGEISREEALQVIQKANKEGLVHFTENAVEIKHICNCCGCACWNVRPIKQRKIPRDAIMAVYFIRETDKEKCNGCGACVKICPVDAVAVNGEKAKVDVDWCIGCGVCALKCKQEAIKILEREDKPLQAENLQELYTKIGIQRWKNQ